MFASEKLQNLRTTPGLKTNLSGQLVNICNKTSGKVKITNFPPNWKSSTMKTLATIKKQNSDALIVRRQSSSLEPVDTKMEVKENGDEKGVKKKNQMAQKSRAVLTEMDILKKNFTTVIDKVLPMVSPPSIKTNKTKIKKHEVSRVTPPRINNWVPKIVKQDSLMLCHVEEGKIEESLMEDKNSSYFMATS